MSHSRQKAQAIEFNNLQNQLNAVTAQRDQLNITNSQLVSQNSAIQDLLDQAQAEIAKLKSEYETNMKNSSNEKTGLTILLNQSTIEKRTLQLNNEALAKETKVLAIEKDAIQSSLKEVNEQLQQANEQLAQANKENNILRADIKEQAQYIDVLGDDLKLVQTSLNQFALENDEAKKEIVKLQKDKESITKELAYAQHEKEAAQNQVSDEVSRLNAENAALCKKIEMLQQLVALQNNEIEEYKNPNVFLLNNAARGNLENVKSALDKGANIEAKDAKTQATAVYLSIINNHLDVADYLINAGAELEVENNDGKKLLEAAVSYNNIDSDVAKLVISHYPKRDGGKALKAAYEVCNNDNIKTYIVNKLLLQAAKQGLVELAEFALAHGADVNTKDEVEEDTALHKACYYGYPEVVKVLLKNGCDIDATNKHDSIPLNIVSVKAKEEIKQLFEHHANLKQMMPALIHGFFSRKDYSNTHEQVKGQAIAEAQSLIPQLLASHAYEDAQKLIVALQTDKLNDILSAISKCKESQQPQPKMN